MQLFTYPPQDCKLQGRQVNLTTTGGIIEISRSGLCRQGQKIERLEMVPHQREWSLYVS
jgi:hypothetical protein